MMPKTKIYKDYEGKICKTPSLTIPDQTMSMRKLMERYAQGLPLEGHTPKTAHYDEESNGINIKTLDLVDLEMLHDGNTVYIQELKKPKQQPKQSNEGDEAIILP